MTSARVLTPAGRGAIAVIAVTGPEAVSSVDDCFSAAGGRRVSESPVDQIRFGAWGKPCGEEVVVVPTGNQTVEIHCHGGLAAARAVLDSLRAAGVSLDRQTKFSASLAEDARHLLSIAPTELVAGILLDQAGGALDNAVSTAMDAIDSGDPDSALEIVGQLLSHRRLTERLVRPWRVVLTGPPNVGKSSLINALVGFDRAVVFDQPGTTRDVVTASTAINGWPVVLADTAGIRQSNDPLEQAGVSLAESEVSSADVIVRVRDARDEPVADDLPDIPVVLVANKSDLAPDATLAAGEIATAAPSNRGVGDLLDAIGRALGVRTPTAGAAVPFRAWHLDALTAVEKALRAGLPDAATAALLAMRASDDSAG